MAIYLAFGFPMDTIVVSWAGFAMDRGIDRFSSVNFICFGGWLGNDLLRLGPGCFHSRTALKPSTGATVLRPRPPVSPRGKGCRKALTVDDPSLVQ